MKEKTGSRGRFESDLSGGQLQRLKWLMTLLPASTVYSYETVRHDILDPLIPTAWGNLVVGLLALIVSYVFAEIIFSVIERFQREAIEREREVTMLNAIVAERERLSHELHDGLAQVIAYLLVRIDTVQGLVDAGRVTEANVEIESLRRVADDLYADVRESISGLRVQIFEGGLPKALRDYAAEFVERHDVGIDLDLDEFSTKASPEVALQLLRIAQEALANAGRHARAKNVWVSLTGQDSSREIQLTIRDDGCGFDPSQPPTAPPRSFGLTTMRERAQSLGGSLQVVSQPGAGTSVVVTVPLNEKRPAR